MSTREETRIVIPVFADEAGKVERVLDSYELRHARYLPSEIGRPRVRELERLCKELAEALRFADSVFGDEDSSGQVQLEAAGWTRAALKRYKETKL